MQEKNNGSIIGYVINGILAVAVIILFILFFTKKTGDQSCNAPMQTHTVTLEDGTVVEQKLPLLPIAYIQGDSIYSAYKFFIDQTESLQAKYTKDMSDVQTRSIRLQQEYTQWQQDLRNNRYLTQAEAEQKGVSLQRREQELQNSAMQVEQNSQIQLQELSKQLLDSVNVAIDMLNADKQYQIIFLNEGKSTILYADQSYDLTDKVIELLNSRYTTEAKQ